MHWSAVDASTTFPPQHGDHTYLSPEKDVVFAAILKKLSLWQQIVECIPTAKEFPSIFTIPSTITRSASFRPARVLPRFCDRNTEGMENSAGNYEKCRVTWHQIHFSEIPFPMKRNCFQLSSHTCFTGFVLGFAILSISSSSALVFLKKKRLIKGINWMTLGPEIGNHSRQQQYFEN